jgi:predicted Zn-dependent protease with MMP-like domain
MNRARFEILVRKAVSELPEAFRKHLETVAIVVQDAPTRAQLERWNLEPEDDDLLGFYDGVPLTERSLDDVSVAGDVIYVFQRAHEETCSAERELTAELRKTVIHEVGHHFGLDDDRIDELGFG